MPNSMTNKYFSEKVYKKLPQNCQNKIKNIDYLNLSSQGSEPLMFYNLIISPKNKYYKKIQELFLNLINYIHKNKLNNNKQVISYLYRNICHYFLDVNDTINHTIYTTYNLKNITTNKEENYNNKNQPKYFEF